MTARTLALRPLLPAGAGQGERRRVAALFASKHSP